MVIRISRLVLRLLVLLLAIAAVAALGFFAWQLATGPVSVAWLNPYIERQLSGERVVVEHRRHAGAPGARSAARAHARPACGCSDPDGRLLSELPEVEIGLSTSAMLLEGAIAVRRIEATAPSLMLTRREDGSIGFDDESASADAADFDHRLAARRVPGCRQTSAERWGHTSRRSGSSAASSVLDDRKVGRTLRARDAELSIARLAIA